MSTEEASSKPEDTVLRFVIGPGERDRVDKIVTRLCGGASRASVQRWIEEGRVTIDGKPCRARDKVGEGSRLEVDPGPPPASAATADASVVFSILYEDQDLLVIDKPAGLVVHPARGHRTGTLVNGLLSHASLEEMKPDPRDPAGPLRPGIVHRIDKDTSGLLVIAKNENAREGLKSQLASHSMERRYRALTIGLPRATLIRTYYGRDPRSRIRFSSRVSQGKLAVTHLSVVETLAAGQAALVECRLETGRTHQIRVHLLEQAKTPLLGDSLYRSPQIPAELEPIATGLGRQALHAGVLGFEHPRSGESLRFESPVPADFALALSQLRAL